MDRVTGAPRRPARVRKPEVSARQPRVAAPRVAVHNVLQQRIPAYLNAYSRAQGAPPTPRDAAECAGHVQQLGSESLLPNLMEVKG